MREMKEMDDRLSAMKLDYAERMKNVKNGELAFLEKQQNTIKYLRRFKTFIVETDTKRNRAEKKENEEKKQSALKSAEIVSLRSLLASLRAKRDDLMMLNNAYKSNRAYLESVLVNSDQYSEVDELLTRHTILKQTHSDLKKDAEKVQKKMETTQANLQKLIKEKQNVRKRNNNNVI